MSENNFAPSVEMYKRYPGVIFGAVALTVLTLYTAVSCHAPRDDGRSQVPGASGAQPSPTALEPTSTDAVVTSATTPAAVKTQAAPTTSPTTSEKPLTATATTTRRVADQAATKAVPRQAASTTTSPVAVLDAPLPETTTRTTAATVQAEPSSTAKAPAGGFKNCAAAWAAGAAPVHRGQPGYHKRLDRDGDGVGCEKRP